MTFQSYYQHYLGLHQNKNCRRLHLFGMAVGMAFFIIGLCTPYWGLFLAAPFVCYPFAWVGHFAFEKNTPAAWRNPLFATWADLHMTWDIFRGRLEL
jgi:hypothetical protein